MRSSDSNTNIGLTAAFPSSSAFDAINDSLKSDEAERKKAIKDGNAVFAFTIKNKAGETESWNIDLKTKGEVSKGLGEKPTGEQTSTRRKAAAKLNKELPRALG